MSRRERAAPRARQTPSNSPAVVLPARLADSLALGHPWVYRNHVPAGVAFPSGTWVELRAGGFRGFALWDASSPIALRVFSRRALPDRAFFRERVREATALRASLAKEGTNAYRLLFGEGDGVPGLTVDLYGRFAVLITYADSLDVVVPHVVEALRAELPLDGVLRRKGRAEAAERTTVLWGSAPPRDLVVEERGLKMRADLEHGQKTGLFLDHRENRAYIRALAGGRTVLNLFSYTGAFSVYAAAGGAARVTSVDVAAQAVGASRENFALNGFPPEQHEFVAADVFAHLDALRGRHEKFDIVICDPPSFASSRDQQRTALRAYARLHALALSAVSPGGLYAAASCTAQVSPEAFRQTLAEGAARSGVRLQLIHDIGHAPDHPVFAGHLEGRYLKFMVGRVLERV